MSGRYENPSRGTHFLRTHWCLRARAGLCCSCCELTSAPQQAHGASPTRAETSSRTSRPVKGTAHAERPPRIGLLGAAGTDPPGARHHHVARTPAAARRDQGRGDPRVPGVRGRLRGPARPVRALGDRAEPDHLRGPGGAALGALATAGRDDPYVRPVRRRPRPQPGHPARHLPHRRPGRAAPYQEGGQALQPLPGLHAVVRGHPVRVHGPVGGAGQRGLSGGQIVGRGQPGRVTEKDPAADRVGQRHAPGHPRRTGRTGGLAAAGGADPGRAERRMPTPPAPPCTATC